MSMQSRQDVVQRLRAKYARAGVRYRRQLITEACSVCGYERKYAIKVLSGNRPGPRGQQRGGGRRRYGPAEAALVAALWRLGDYPCGKRLVAMIPLWLPAYEAHHGQQPARVCARVRAASAATLDRLLVPVRARVRRGRGGTRPGSLLRTQIPVRCESWNVDRPGYLEADTVAHGGSSGSGDFMHSLTLTDIFSGWTEQAALWNKGAPQVVERTRSIEAALPFPLLGFDCDKGSEFLNHHLVAYFGQRPRGVQFTRSRAYHKNDNAHVEQKNWSKVRQLLGYARYDQPELVALVQDLYRNEWRLLQNFFHPVMKLVQKQRRGSRVVKTYDRPQTPAQRLLAWAELAPEQRAWLQQQQHALDPLALAATVQRKLQRLRRILMEGSRDAA